MSVSVPFSTMLCFCFCSVSVFALFLLLLCFACPALPPSALALVAALTRTTPLPRPCCQWELVASDDSVISGGGRVELDVSQIVITPRTTDMVQYLQEKCPCVKDWAANKTVTFKGE